MSFHVKEPKASGGTGIKVVLVGDSGVGKTSFLYSYKANSFPNDEEVPAILDSFVDLVVDEDGGEMEVELWDVGGADNYRVLRPMIYRDAHVSFAVDRVPGFSSASICALIRSPLRLLRSAS